MLDSKLSKNNVRKIIKDSINKYFGNDLEYALIRIDVNQYILITPYLDYKNDFIELEIYIDDKNKLIISYPGKIIEYFFRNDFELYKKKNLYDRIKRITNYAGMNIKENKFRIKTDFKNTGESIFNLIKTLQMVYNLISSDEKEDKEEFSYILQELSKSSN